MRKRLSSRLLAVILTLSICASTVLGCLMTVSAADSCYRFSEGKFNADDLTQATIDLTFTAPESLPNGFVTGAFAFSEADADSADYLIFDSVTSNDVNFTLEDNYVLFESDEAKTTAKFTFTVKFANGDATDRTYKIKLTDIELAYNDKQYYDEAVGSVLGQIATACKHEIAVVGEPVAKDEANDYSVYAQSVCTKCGETFGYQLVPTAGALGTGSDSSSADLPTEEDTFAGRSELVVKYDQAGDSSKSAADSANWVLDCEGTPHRTWGYIDADLKLLDETKENSESNPYIVENAEQLFYLVKIGGSKTAGKYYKVKDGIRAFHLNPNVTDKTSFEDMMANISKSGANWDSAAPFQGHFDGNGVIITGIRTTTNHSYAGLFPQITGNVTIKNVTIMNSYLIGRNAVGGFFGTQIYDSAKGEVYDITIENCAIYQCYMQSTHSQNGVGAIGGFVSNACNPGTGWINGDTIINNCYVNLDEEYFISTTETSGNGSHGGAIGYQGSSVMNVTNSIFIGVRPYTARALTGDKTTGNYGWQGAKATCYNNVYTTHPCDDAYTSGSTTPVDFTGRIFTLTDAQFKGKDADLNMLTLDFDTVWGTTAGYPVLYMPYNRPEVPTNIIYWDGTVATGIAEGTGAKDDPYIINTVAEFAYAVGQTRANYAITDGKYFKLAEGIDTIVLQPKSLARQIMALDSAAEVKSFFESASGLLTWKYYGWEVSTFCGNIDFNGATIYGGYIKDSANNAALISNIDAGAVISNLALKNCYFTSASGSYQVGAIAAVTNGATYGKSANGFIWYNNCTVANNYLYNSSTSHDRSGVLCGASSDIIYVDNCLIYGNDATYGSGVVMPILGSANNSVNVNTNPTIPEGLTTITVMDGANELYYNMVRNSVIFGTYPFDTAQTTGGARFNEYRCYAGVYTDMDLTKLTSVKPEQITRIAATDALGTAAQSAMPNLTWGTDWYCGTSSEYPVQKVFATFGAAEVSNADIVLVAQNTTYNNDGSVNLNFHFVPKTAGAVPVLYVGAIDGSKFMKLEATTSTATDELGDDALMYVIPNISARDIELVWLPTLVSEGSTLKEWGQSEQTALADYSKAVLTGDYSAADKNVAAAFLNYGSASTAALNVSTPDYDAGTIDLLEFGQYLKDNGSTSNYYDTNVADNGELGTEADPIIIDSAEELVYLCKASGNETEGKYYKVADGIAGFNLSTNKLDITKGYDANKAIITGTGKNHSGNTPGFQGHFDGNGATVYGAWTSDTSGYAGLFSCTKGDVSIKNINVRLSHFYGKYSVGGIVGYHEATLTAAQAKTATQNSGTLVLPQNGTLLIENCSVAECYLESTGTSYGTGAVAAILGYENNSWSDANVTYASGLVDASALTLGYYDVDGNGKNTYYNGEFTINNCYVNLDNDKLVSAYAADNQAVRGGLAAYAGTNAGVFKNCIVIGITPYSTYKNTANNNHQHTALASHFSNIYTTAATGKVTIGGSVGTNDYTGKVFQLTEEQLTGLTANANMPALDWNNVWTTTSGYPTFINKDYVAPTGGITIYWDGTVASSFASGTGTKEDPYIIATASQLAYLIKDNASISPNKYFKVADGISNIVLQKADYSNAIISLGSAAEVKSYFEANSASMYKWPNYGWEGSSFAGYFDGNGATVYGLYQVSGNNAALFANADAGATICNIAVKNSYLTSTAGNYQVAGIVASSNSSGYGVKQEGVIWVNGCTVANNYMYNSSTSYIRSGVIAGSIQNDIIVIDNCITYGNDATYGDGVKMALVGQGNNDVETTKLKPAELTTYIENGGFFCNSVRNSIILDCDVMNAVEGRSYRRNAPNCYANVYTNGASGTVAFPSDTSWTYTDAQIKAINAADVKGDAGADIVNALNAVAIGNTTWYVGATNEMPGFKPAGSMPSGAQALYDAVAINTLDDYGDSTNNFGVYTTGLNLKANPYMTFTFVFGYEYAREDIQVTFKSGDTVIETVTAADMVNNSGAGRYHLYRLKSAPITALATGISVEVSYDGTPYNFGTYSAEGFALLADNANKTNPCSYYATRYEAAKALLFYTQMLDVRYGA